MKIPTVVSLNLLSGSALAQLFCADFCLYSQAVGSDLIKFRIEAPTSIQGWFGFGFGSSMADAEIYVAYPSGQSLALDHRYASQRAEPMRVAPDFTIWQNETAIEANIQYITFTRARSPSLSQARALSEAPISLIWAFNAEEAPGADVELSYHQAFDIVPNLSLLAESSSFSRGGNDDSGQDDTSPGNSDGSGGSAPVFKPKPKDNNNREYFIVLHGWFMVVAWFLLAPGAIIVARFMKTALGVWWFRIHVFLFILVLLFTAFGFALVWASIDLTPYTHLDPSNFDSTGGAHIVMGMFVIVATPCQIISGAAIDYLFSPTRTSIPWWDKLHWYLTLKLVPTYTRTKRWFGRTVFFFAWLTVPLGISLYATLFDDTHKGVNLGLLFAWAILIILGFGFLQYRVGQTHDAVTAKLESTDSLEADSPNDQQSAA